MILCLRQLFMLAVASLLPLLAAAQLTITSPVARMVFQRNLANEAAILVAGVAPATATTIEARFVPLALGQGTLTPWISLSFVAGSRAFQGAVPVKGGWYRLDVRAMADGSQLALTQVNRVGVGEVFVVAGQSNAVGGFEREPGADDDRVSCIDVRQYRLDDQLLPLMFNRASTGSNIGPSQPPHIWARLGDRLVRRLNVPVLFLGGAQPGTSSTEWQQSASGQPDPSGQLLPYQRLGSVLQHYVARTGARAVLWHQGEGDIGSSETQYFNNLQTVIAKSRQQAGYNQLPWLISRVSFIQGQFNPSVIAAQNRLIAQINDVYAGPSTDDLQGPDNRLGDNVHLGGNGLVRFIDRWEQSLTDDFFGRATPLTPSGSAPLLTTGYSLPLKRRPGDVIQVASLRTDAHEAGNQYYAQLVRASDQAVVAESPRSQDNPLLLTLPVDLPAGQYRLRTLTTAPATTGTLGEAFTVDPNTPAIKSGNAPLPTVQGGSPDAAIGRIGYRYESDSHGFFAMVQASVAVEIRIQRIDGGPFDDSAWHVMPPASQAPDYPEFVDFNYVRNYPPQGLATGGVEPGRYRLSVRKQGDTGEGVWCETTTQSGRTTVYQGPEAVSGLPPVLTLANPSIANCPGTPFDVSFALSESSVNADNRYTLQLADASGSFDAPIELGSSTTSPIATSLPISVLAGTSRPIRVVASSPAVYSLPASVVAVCASAPAQADLSLTMQSASRIAAINQPVTLTLTLNNDGPSTAAGVSLRSRLPVGMSFVDAASPGVSAAAGVIDFATGNLSSGGSMRYIFRVKPTRPGTYMLAAEVSASQTPDPDSQPNSGTGDGQDDATQVDLRTIVANSDTLRLSPNPNQVPLPSVRLAEPTPDASSADLSLTLRTNELTPALNDVMSVTAVVANRGGRAGSATVVLQLPTGWQLVNTAGFTVAGQFVTGTLGQLASGSSDTLVFPIRISASGTLKAQIQTASLADPDSTPGNGYDNGEDDTASVAVRGH